MGKPKDSDPRCRYVILTIHADNYIKDKETVQVSFIRFDYDVEKASTTVREQPADK